MDDKSKHPHWVVGPLLHFDGCDGKEWRVKVLVVTNGSAPWKVGCSPMCVCVCVVQSPVASPRLLHIPLETL
jgi:hypothetical protein